MNANEFSYKTCEWRRGVYGCSYDAWCFRPAIQVILVAQSKHGDALETPVCHACYPAAKRRANK